VNTLKEFVLYLMKWRNAKVKKMAKLRFYRSFYCVKNLLNFSKNIYGKNLPNFAVHPTLILDKRSHAIMHNVVGAK
jgi:hypothetical protein